MLVYEPDDALAHRLDPRSKLAFQFGFAAAALAHTAVPALVGFTAVTALALAAARVPLGRALAAFRFPVALLAAGPLVATVALDPLRLEPAAAVEPALASYRVVLILFVSGAYVRSTPVRHSRAAIQRTVPGNAGRLLASAVALVFRFLPVLVSDLRAIREASAARMGTERSALERASSLGALGLTRSFERADRLSVAMQARCFSWNPTLPPLSVSRLDAPVALAALALIALAAV